MRQNPSAYPGGSAKGPGSHAAMGIVAASGAHSTWVAGARAERCCARPAQALLGVFEPILRVRVPRSEIAPNSPLAVLELRNRDDTARSYKETHGRLFPVRKLDPVIQRPDVPREPALRRLRNNP